MRFPRPAVTSRAILAILLAHFGVFAVGAQTFSAAGSIPTPLCCQTATRLQDGTVLITGGYPSGGNPPTTAAALTYNPSTKAFKSTNGEMTTPRALNTATLLPNGLVLIAGGFGAGDPVNALASAELYNPATGTFALTGAMANARVNAAAALLSDGEVLVAGGGLSAPTNTAEIYNPATGTFRTTGSMTVGRDAPSATLLADGNVLIAGGSGIVNGLTAVLSSAELYVPSSGQFTPVSNMTTPRIEHTATLLTDGTVLIAGGVTDSGTLSTAEIYTPSSLSFAATGSLTTTRGLHTATALADGTVLIAGGMPSEFKNAFTNTAEVYSLTSHTFTQTGSMEEARSWQTATLLTDGSVLMVGGGTATSEIYTYPFTSGAFTPKYVVLGVLYSPPGAKSSVTYSTSTMVGTSSQFTDTSSTSTKISASLGISGSNEDKSISGSLTGTVSYTWGQEADSISTYTVNKTQTTGVAVAGPLSSAIGVDHDYDTVVVWLNPKVNLSVGTATTDLLWNGYSYDSSDIYSPDGPDIVYLSIFCLKNPFLSPDCTGSNYLTSRSWDTSGLGGLTMTDYATIAARDPFYSNPNYNPDNDPLNRFTPTQQSVDFKPAAVGGGPITESGSLNVQTTDSLGQSATDTYQLTYALDASLKALISADFSDTKTTSWSNKWSTTQTNTVGQTASYSVTTPVATDNYSGPQSFEVFQDNVYGTFMFNAPGTTPTSPGNIRVSPTSITFSPAVVVGSASSPAQITLTNNASTPMYMGVSSAFPFTSTSTALSPVAAFSNPAFSVVPGTDACTGKIIQAGASCTLSVQLLLSASDSVGSGGAIDGTIYLTAETDAAVLAKAFLAGTEAAASGAAATPTIANACVSAPCLFEPVTGVSMSDATAGAIIHYTIDGTTPTTSSTVYTGVISISGPTTFKALAVAKGYLNSTVATVTLGGPVQI